MATKSWLSNHDISFDERNISTSKDYQMSLLKMGYKVTPVTFIGEKAIVGYNPTKLIEALSAEKES